MERSVSESDSADWLVFLPPSFWDSAGRFIRKRSILDTFRDVAWEFRRRLRELGNRAPYLAPTRQTWPLRGEERWTVATLLLIAILAGFNSLFDNPLVPRAIAKAPSALGMGQTWNMFSDPMRDDGTFRCNATLSDDSHVDLLDSAGVIARDKRQGGHWLATDRRWRKFLRNLSREDNLTQRAVFVEWLRREWDLKHPNRTVVSQTLSFELEFTMPPGESPKEGRVLYFIWDDGRVQNLSREEIDDQVRKIIVPSNASAPEQTRLDHLLGRQTHLKAPIAMNPLLFSD